MGKIYNSILDTVGRTPIVRINNLGPKHVNLFVKVESFNPMGSVKDRLALGVIEDAERKGELKPGQTIVEATSGNTGIGLAMVCAQKGYPLVIVMAENFSIERRKMIRFLGAEVILTPASEKGTGMIKKAAELASEHGWWQPKQFENPANAEVHRTTTAQEILNDFSDRSLDYWVSGFGTGGTFSGVSQALREHSPNTQIMICEPDNSQLIGSGVAQVRNPDGSHSQSHPSFRPHLMQGWSPDFIPTLVEQALETNSYDATIPVDGNFSLQCAKDLAQKEGIFVGITAGATFAGMLKVAETAPAGSNILCMLPDTGERYLSTPLFEDIAVEMTESEMKISRSTKSYRFDVAATAAPAENKPVELDSNSVKTVDAYIEDPEQPVTMFALEWCEFCWSVRKVLKAYGIDYQSVDLDSVKYQQDNLGGKMRAALSDKTGWNTFPQIFIKGEFVGGCTDLFDAIKDGSIFSRLENAGVTVNKEIDIDPYQLLPGWLHSRN
jgi:cysteine synthase A